jgi:hypothetical protein
LRNHFGSKCRNDCATIMLDAIAFGVNGFFGGDFQPLSVTVPAPL